MSSSMATRSSAEFLVFQLGFEVMAEQTLVGVGEVTKPMPVSNSMALAGLVEAMR